MNYEELDEHEDGDDEYDPDPDCADEEPEGCCLGTACLNPRLYHFACECFDAEMAEAFMSEGADATEIQS